jgi:hypothetical protein
MFTKPKLIAKLFNQASINQINDSVNKGVLEWRARRHSALPNEASNFLFGLQKNMAAHSCNHSIAVRECDSPSVYCQNW